MNLYRIQDDRRPCYVIASDFTEALFVWQAQMERENADCRIEPPDGVELVARGTDVDRMPGILWAAGAKP